MKVGTKLAGGYAVLMGLMGLLLLEHLSTIREVASANRRLTGTISQLSLSAITGLRLLDEMQENADKFVVLRDQGYARRYGQAATAFEETLERLRALPLSGAEGTALERLSEEWRRFRGSAPTLSRLVVGGVSVQDSLLTAIDSLRARTSEIEAASREAIIRQLQRSNVAVREAERVTRITVVLAIVVGIVISTLVVRSISDSFHRLHQATQAVAKGDFSVRIDESRDDEFADLARDFNVMTTRLGQVDTAKRDFFSSVSHNLKSPLASIQETSRLLLDRLPGELNARQDRLLRLSMESGERLARMISNLLDLSTMEAGAMEYRLEAVDIGALARRVGERYRARLAAREISVRVEAPPRLDLACDGNRIEQVLENLLENAIRFSPRGSTIGLAVQESPAAPAEARDRVRQPRDGRGWVAIQVRDSGPGVADEHKETIFGRFQQLRRSERVPGAGVGLGLAICREIAAAHRGAIWVADNPGGGSVFTLMLPEAPSAPTGPVAPEGGTGSSRDANRGAETVGTGSTEGVPREILAPSLTEGPRHA